MRLYTFVNCLYMRPIQFGIQSLHLLGDLNVKYEFLSEGATRVLVDWQRHHKTVIILNGGNLKGLKDIYAQLEQLAPACGLPFDKFHEDEESLGSIMTCCGLVVPAIIYDAVLDEEFNRIVYTHRNDQGIVVDLTIYEEGSPQWNLYKLLKSYPLAK